jgi:hypothetical protein
MADADDLMHRTWLLLAADGGVLAHLVGYEVDQPWIHCHFRPQPRFAFVARLFAEELAFFQGEGFKDRWEEWESAYNRIRALRLKLQRASGGPRTRDFLLHIEGDHAWFRTSLR